MGKTVVAIEIKSGAKRQALAGAAIFSKQFKPKRSLLVGGQGILLQDFFLSQPLIG